jgi:hypothetical protein
VSRTPNFFVVGAPRCGTTAITEHLSRQHPDVFICSPKEPRYFADDFGPWRQVHSRAEYLRLFEDANDCHVAVGEGSTVYLYSDSAISNILTFDPSARFIAILRNPIDAVPSLHALLLYNREEDEPSFERAWQLQDDRRRGFHLPKACLAPKLLQYRAFGLYGEQVERLAETVEKSQVLVLLFDDLVKNPLSVHDQLTTFLRLGPTQCKTIESANENRYNRAPRLAQVVRKPPRNLLWLRQRLAARGGLGIATRLIELQTERRRRDGLSEHMKGVLRAAFRDDIGRLERVIGRDLSHWLK